MAGLSDYLKQLGEPVRPGQALTSVLTAGRINGILLAIRALASGENIRTGPGLRRSATSSSVIISRLGNGTAATAADSHPFQVLDASSNGSAKVQVVFGQVNSLTPSINGTGLGENPADPPLLQVATGPVYLAVILDSNGRITSASIHNNGSLPEADPTHGYLTLATVTASQGGLTAINQSVTHSLGHQKCGSTVHNFWGL